MNRLIFATNNSHKLQEVSSMLSGLFDITGLSQTDFSGDIPETAETLQGNALMKAKYIYNILGEDCFADDTGLEVEALGGEPGVYSARYAGTPVNSQKNIDKLLKKLKNIDNRNASFRTVLALILDGQTHFFDGTVKGTITTEQHGDKGFGYDSVFVPEGYDRTFAQMTDDEKNSISHRSRAVAKLVDFLKSKTQQQPTHI